MSKRFFYSVYIWVLLQMIFTSPCTINDKKLQEQEQSLPHIMKSEYDSKLNLVRKPGIIPQSNKIHLDIRNKDICNTIEKIPISRTFFINENIESSDYLFVFGDSLQQHKKQSCRYNLNSGSSNAENGYKKKISVSKSWMKDIGNCGSVKSILNDLTPYIDKILCSLWIHEINICRMLESGKKLIQDKVDDVEISSHICSDEKVQTKHTRNYFQPRDSHKCSTTEKCQLEDQKPLRSSQENFHPNDKMHNVTKDIYKLTNRKNKKSHHMELLRAPQFSMKSFCRILEYFFPTSIIEKRLDGSLNENNMTVVLVKTLESQSISEREKISGRISFCGFNRVNCNSEPFEDTLINSQMLNSTQQILEHREEKVLIKRHTNNDSDVDSFSVRNVAINNDASSSYTNSTEHKKKLSIQDETAKIHKYKNRYLLSTNNFSNIRKQSESSVKPERNRKNEEKRRFRRRSNGASNRDRDRSRRFSKKTGSSTFVRPRKSSDTVASYLVNEDVESRAFTSNSMKRSSVVSFPSDDYRRDIEHRIARDSDEIKDTPQSGRRIAPSKKRRRRRRSRRSPNNRRSIKRARENSSETAAAVAAIDDTPTAEIITISRDCGNASQRIVRKSLDKPQASLDYRSKIAESDLVIGKQDRADAADNTKKLLARVLIISSFPDGRRDLPLSLTFQPSRNETAIADYSVDSVSLKLDELAEIYKNAENYKFDAMVRNERDKNVLFGETRNDNDEAKRLEDELKQLKTMHIQEPTSLINNRKHSKEMRKTSDGIVFPNSKQDSSPSRNNMKEVYLRNNNFDNRHTNEGSSKSMSGTNEKASGNKKLRTLSDGRRLITNKKLSKHRRKKQKKSRVVRQKQLRTNHGERIRKAKALHRTPVEIYESPGSSVISENEKLIHVATTNSSMENILFPVNQLSGNYLHPKNTKNNSPGNARGSREKVISGVEVGSLSYQKIGNVHYPDYDTESYEETANHEYENQYVRANGMRRKLLSLNSIECDKEVVVPCKDSSDYDYGKKFYEDQSYGKEKSQLYNSPMDSSASQRSEITEIKPDVESNELYYDRSKDNPTTLLDINNKNRYLNRRLRSFQELNELSEEPSEKEASRDVYFTGDLVGYDSNSKQMKNKARNERESDNAIKDENLAKLFSNGQEYDIAVKGKIHLHLHDPDSKGTSSKSAKKKRCSGSKTEKSRKKVPRVKSNSDKQRREKKSATPTKSRNPLQRITDFFKKKFGKNEDNADSRKKIHANAKLVRITTGEETTITPSSSIIITGGDDPSLNDGCQCNSEKTTTSTENLFTSVIIDTESTFQEPETTTSPGCQYERTTEISSTIASTTEHQYQDEYNNPSTKQALPHEIALKGFPETTKSDVINIAVTSEKTTVPANHNWNSADQAEKIKKMQNMLEVLNFIKKLEKLIGNGKEPFRFGDENGGIEIKLEKIYIRPGTNQSIQELKDRSSSDEQTEDLSVKADTPNAIHQLDGNVPSPSSWQKEDKEVSNEHSNNGQDSDEDTKKNDVIKKHKEYDNELIEAYLEPPLGNSLIKDTSRTKEHRISKTDQSSSLRTGDASSIGRVRGRKDSPRKKKKRRRAHAGKLHRRRVARRRRLHRRKKRWT